MLLRSVWVVHYKSNSTNGWSCLRCIVSVITCCSVLSGLKRLVAASRFPRLPRRGPLGSIKLSPEVENVLGSSLSARETNSARPGYYLWGACYSSALTRRRSRRWLRHGRNSERPGHSLASRHRRGRQGDDAGTARQPTAPPPRQRRCAHRRRQN